MLKFTDKVNLQNSSVYLSQKMLKSPLLGNMLFSVLLAGGVLPIHQL
jgi:hypothetical protein